MSDHIREAVERMIYPGDNADPDDIEARVRATLARRVARAALPVKVCPTCSRDLPASAFSVDYSRPDGLRGKCRECESTSARDRRTGTAHYLLGEGENPIR